MSINATTSSVSATASSTSVTSSQNPETQKSSADSSFKDEMDKVSKSEKEDNKVKDVKDDKVAKDDKTTEKIDAKNNDTTKNTTEKSTSENNNAEDTKLAAMSMMDVNTLLSNDIEQMINTTQISDKNESIIGAGLKNNSDILSLDFTNSLSMTENDALFFINLTQNNTVNAQAVINQAQMALDNGAELNQVQQNVKISETLLNAINTARETNQPLRIDFDQNISVILRMGKDGSFAANFIPGDKVVEQYLKNNIETLKSTFEEKELPYTDLSYSNRGSKRQKEERNNK